MKRVLLIGALLVSAVAAVWAVAKIQTVSREIEDQSRRDEATKADIIIVLGAAEYRGKAFTPVLEARLNHALFLYLQGLAPRILTTGGAGGDPTFTRKVVSPTII